MIAFFFGLNIILSSFLLFQIQLIVAKNLLPWFGGVSSVWTTCMLFFQVLLLLGYGWSYTLASKLKLKRQVALHGLVLLATIAFVVFQYVNWTVAVLPPDRFFLKAPDRPELAILFILSVTIGPVFFLLSTTSTLLQTWFHRIMARSPYKLYALSNAGSMIGLLSYPFIIERVASLHRQAQTWFFGYLLYCLVFILIAGLVFMRSGNGKQPSDVSDHVPETLSPPASRTRFSWILFAAIATTALIAFTNQISQEIAVIPFLWVMPLSVYLLTLIIAFSGNGNYPRKLFGILLVVLSIVMSISLIKAKAFSYMIQILLFLATLFVVCMICHGELVRRKPKPAHLGSYYLFIASGGALGGIFAGIIAPVVFNGYWELHVSLAACAFLFFDIVRKEKRETLNRGARGNRRLIYYAPPALVALALISHIVYYHSNSIFSRRSFFSVIRVEEKTVKNPPSRVRFLMHGITTHGFQFTEEQYRSVPTCYYGTQSGAGLSLMKHPKRTEETRLSVGAVGLGIGTISAYGRPGDNFDFFEIDPYISELAMGKKGLFSYLEKCKADYTIINGDGRISLERMVKAGVSSEGIYDVLVLDAFSSDSVPTHLLTREAFALYFQVLKDDGILAVHTSNRTLAVAWIVIRQAMEVNIPSAVIITEGDKYTFSSEWVLVTSNEEFLALPEVSLNMVPYDLFSKRYHIHLWTDEYSNLFEIVKGRGPVS